MEGPLLVPQKAAAKLLSVSPRTLRRLIVSGVLATVSLGGRPMVPMAEILRVAQPTKPVTEEVAAALEVPPMPRRRRKTAGDIEVERLRALRARRT